MSGTLWTAAQVKDLEDLYVKRRCSVKEIAELLGRTPQAIMRQLFTQRILRGHSAVSLMQQEKARERELASAKASLAGEIAIAKAERLSKHPPALYRYRGPL